MTISKKRFKFSCLFPCIFCKISLFRFIFVAKQFLKMCTAPDRLLLRLKVCVEPLGEHLQQMAQSQHRVFQGMTCKNFTLSSVKNFYIKKH